MLAVVLMIIQVFAQANPETGGKDKKRAISYQSQIKDDQGAVIQDGKYKINFNLYDAENAEKPVWFENQNIEIKDGILNALIGSQKKLQPELFKDQLWLTIEINDEESEKQFVAASSYSMVASRIEKDALVAGEAVLLSELPDGKIKIDINGPPNNPVLYISNIILYLTATGVEYCTIQNSLKANVGALMWNSTAADYQGGLTGDDFVVVAKDGRDLVLKSDPNTLTGVNGNIYVGTKTRTNNLSISGDVIANKILSETGKNLYFESIGSLVELPPEIPEIQSTTLTGGNIFFGTSTNPNSMRLYGQFYADKIMGNVQPTNLTLGMFTSEYDYLSLNNQDGAPVGSFLWNYSSTTLKTGDDFEDFVISAKNGRDLVLMSEDGEFGTDRTVSVGTTSQPNNLNVTGNLSVLDELKATSLKLGNTNSVENYDYLTLLNNTDKNIGGFMYSLSNPAWNGSNSGEFLGMYSESGSDIVIKSNKNIETGTYGDIFIGAYTNPNNLYVYGKLTAREVNVRLEIWPDYVFKNDYNLLPLSEIESHINSFGRLPGMPSEKEVVENGLNLNQMQLKLVEKIEELTLHMIRLEKENNELKEMIYSAKK